METAIIAVLGSGAGGSVVAAIQWLRGRRKDRAEAADIVVDAATDVIAILREEIAELQRQQEDNRLHIEQLEAKMGRWEQEFRRHGIKPPNGHPVM